MYFLFFVNCDDPAPMKLVACNESLVRLEAVLRNFCSSSKLIKIGKYCKKDQFRESDNDDKSESDTDKSESDNDKSESDNDDKSESDNDINDIEKYFETVCDTLYKKYLDKKICDNHTADAIIQKSNDHFYNDIHVCTEECYLVYINKTGHYGFNVSRCKKNTWRLYSIEKNDCSMRFREIHGDCRKEHDDCGVLAVIAYGSSDDIEKIVYKTTFFSTLERNFQI